jgi:diguanylate cyclase (GGDEF)-like protein/PAS domain S-box-containing protein
VPHTEDEDLRDIQALFEHSLDLICVIGQDGYFKRLNRAFTETLGWPAEHLRSGPIIDFIHEADRPATQEALASLGRGESLVGLENRWRCADGTFRWLQWKAVPSQGLIYAIARDITDQRRTAREQSRHTPEFRTLAEQAASGIMRADPDQLCEYVNASWCAQAGMTADEARGEGWQAAIHPEDRDRVLIAWQETVASARFDERFRFVHPDGVVRWIHGVASPVRDAENALVGYMSTTSDETDARLREVELADANREMRARMAEAESRNDELVLLHEMGDLLQSSLDDADIMSVLVEYMPILFRGSAGAVYLLNQAHNLVEATATWGERLAPTFEPSECWALRRSALHHPRSEGLRCAHLQGRSTPHVCLPMMAQGEMVGVIVLCQNERAVLQRSLVLAKAGADQVALAMANVRLRDTLRSQSIRDSLTGLFNRRYMEETFERELARARRHDKPLSVIMLDVDRFKAYNDSFGHAAADQLLRELGALLGRSFRREDIVCRIGGEEFLAILPGCTASEAGSRAERLRAAVAAMTVSYEGTPVGGATISLGVAEAFEAGETVEHIIRSADEALYRAKRSGRDRVVMAGSWQVTSEAPARIDPVTVEADQTPAALAVIAAT